MRIGEVTENCNQDNIMAVALELLVNETVNCLADMNVKMVTVQNRIDLDSVLERNRLLSYFV